MRHRVAFRSLSRPTGHRMLMLRNLVSSLIEHDQITTTVAKAKETARLADKVITWSKKGQRSHKEQANRFLLNQQVTFGKLFNELAGRYQDRARGFTRLHLYGHRQGDHAATAVLELVDNPKDIRRGLTATRVGRELAYRAQQGLDSEAIQWRAALPSQLAAESMEVQAAAPPVAASVPLPLHKLTKHLQTDVRKAGAAVNEAPFQDMARDSFDSVLGLARVRKDAAAQKPLRDIRTAAAKDAAQASEIPDKVQKAERKAKLANKPIKAGAQAPPRDFFEDVLDRESDWVDEDELIATKKKKAGPFRRPQRRSSSRIAASL